MPKKEFSPHTKIGQKVIKIEINIRSDADKYNRYSINKEGIHINELKIVYQTAYKIALNDLWITNVDRREKGEKRSSHHLYFEDCSVSIKTNDTLFANGVFGTIYTLGSNEVGIKKLSKEMQNKIDKQFGFLTNINISEKVAEYLQK